MRKKIILCIRWYQKWISFDTGIFWKKLGVKKYVCVFYPTCSEYTIQAVEKYGVIPGLWKGCKRVIRCHPWQKNRIDPLN